MANNAINIIAVLDVSVVIYLKAARYPNLLSTSHTFANVASTYIIYDVLVYNVCIFVSLTTTSSDNTSKCTGN